MSAQSNEMGMAPGTRAFRVYHLTDLRTEEEQLESHNYEVLDARRDRQKAARLFGAPTSKTSYVPVAVVQGVDVIHVFRLTNNRDEVDHGWWGDPRVKPTFSGESCRSTQVGDIVVDDLGFGHFCARYEWEAIGSVRKQGGVEG